MGFSCSQHGVPPLRGALLSFASPKESKQRKGDPGSVPAAPVPCATRNAGRLRNSGLRPSDSARRLPPAFLRCSAPPKGPGKPPGAEMGAATIGTGANLIFAPFLSSTATGQYCGKTVEPRRFLAPLSSARNPEGAPTQGSPFLCLLSFGEAKESTPASRAEPQATYEAEKAKPC